MKIKTSKLADIDAILDYGDKVVDSRKKIELALDGAIALTLCCGLKNNT